MKLKRQKGMTLIEIVVALGISAILAALMVEIMTAVNSTMRRTVSMNRRLSHESKYADNLVTADDHGDFDKNIAANIGITFGSHTINAGGVEYKTHYYDPKTSNFADGANYRFMSFDKAVAPVPHPADVFWIEIRLSHDIDPLTQIDIAGTCYSHTLDPLTTDYPTASTVTSDTLMPGDFTFAATGDILRIPVPSSSASGTLHLEFHKDMVDSLGGLHANYVFETVDLDYCTQVMKPSGTIQYYTQTKYSFDGENFAVIN